MEMNKWTLGGKLVYKWTPKKERDKDRQQGGSAAIVSPMRAILTGSFAHSSAVVPGAKRKSGPLKRLQLKFPDDGGEKARGKDQQQGGSAAIVSPMRAIFTGSCAYSSALVPGSKRKSGPLKWLQMEFPDDGGNDDDGEEAPEAIGKDQQQGGSAAIVSPRRGGRPRGRKRTKVDGNFVTINLKRRSYAPTAAGKQRNKKWARKGRRREGAQ